MTYVMSDIHGEYQKFLSILEQIRLKEQDTLYILGDIVDYGEESMELVSDLSLRLNVFSLAGEHDFLAVRMLSGFDKMLKSGATPDEEYIREMTAWVQEGGQTTLSSFRSLDDEQKEGVLEYLEDLTLYEDITVKGQRYVLTHAGIADYEEGADLDDYLPEDFFSEPLDPSYPLMEDAILVVGHSPTRSQRIERGNGSIFLDCGVCEGGPLACLCLDNGKEYYA